MTTTSRHHKTGPTISAWPKGEGLCRSDPGTSVLGDPELPRSCPSPPVLDPNPVPATHMTLAAPVMIVTFVFFFVENPVVFFVAAKSKYLMGKMNITNLCHQWTVSLRRTTQPTLPFFLHPQKETLLLHIKLCFLTLNLSRVGTFMVIDCLSLHKKALIWGQLLWTYGPCLNLTEPLADSKTSYPISTTLPHVLCSLSWALPSFLIPWGPVGHWEHLYNSLNSHSCPQCLGR